MVELIKNEIGENAISEKIGEINTIENKIKDSYKEIYESKEELKSLKSEISANLTGEKLKTILEKELTVDHVKSVLQQAVDKFAAAKAGMEGFNAIYAEMEAGLVFNLQLGLAKLGCKFEMGLDGMYGSRDTRKRVMEFQNAWNLAHPDATIAVDGRAGKETLSKILLALNDAAWDKTKIVPVTAVNEGNNETKEENTAPVTKEMAKENPAAYNLEMKTLDGVEFFVPVAGYEFIDPTGKLGNLATRIKIEKKEMDRLNLTVKQFLETVPDGRSWKANETYILSPDEKIYEFYGNGRMRDPLGKMHNREKKNGKLFVDDKQWYQDEIVSTETKTPEKSKDSSADKKFEKIDNDFLNAVVKDLDKNYIKQLNNFIKTLSGEQAEFFNANIAGKKISIINNNPYVFIGFGPVKFDSFRIRLNPDQYKSGADINYDGMNKALVEEINKNIEAKKEKTEAKELSNKFVTVSKYLNEVNLTMKDLYGNTKDNDLIYQTFFNKLNGKVTFKNIRRDNDWLKVAFNSNNAKLGAWTMQFDTFLNKKGEVDEAKFKTALKDIIAKKISKMDIA